MPLQRVAKAALQQFGIQLVLGKIVEGTCFGRFNVNFFISSPGQQNKWLTNAIRNAIAYQFNSGSRPQKVVNKVNVVPVFQNCTPAYQRLVSEFLACVGVADMHLYHRGFYGGYCIADGNAGMRVSPGIEYNAVIAESNLL